MTIPAFDIAAMLDSEPATWRERGLHWHAYSWRGDGKSMLENEQGRSDTSSDLPPLIIRDWLRKPQRLLRAAPLTPEDATRWLRQEYEAIVPQLMGDIGGGHGVADRMRLTVYDLRCGNDVVVGHWLRGGAFVHLAVLSVSGRECSRHAVG